MGICDALLIMVILAAAGWLFYRSFIKKKGGCAGCGGCGGKDSRKGDDHLIRLS
jgi:hypothetical protein